MGGANEGCKTAEKKLPELRMSTTQRQHKSAREACEMKGMKRCSRPDHGVSGGCGSEM